MKNFTVMKKGGILDIFSLFKNQLKIHQYNVDVVDGKFFNHRQHVLNFGDENHLYIFLRIFYKQIILTLYMITDILSLSKPTSFV